MDLPFEEDTWITGADVLPGDRQALHHVIAFILPPEGERRRYRRWLTGYAPGVEASRFPSNTGCWCARGSDCFWSCTTRRMEKLSRIKPN